MTRWLRVTRDGTRTLDTCEAETIHEARFAMRGSYAKGSYVTSEVSHKLAWIPPATYKVCIHGDGRPRHEGRSVCYEYHTADQLARHHRKKHLPSYKDRQRTWRESKRRAAQRRKEANG